MPNAYGAGDYTEYLRNVQIVHSLLPNHPATLLHLARAYALTGDTAAALETLKQLAPLGAATAVEQDSAFTSLQRSENFQQVARQLAANATPRVRSDTAFLVPDPDLLPEGITYDPASESFYLGSLYQNKIVRVTPEGAVSDFAVLGPKGSGKVLGMTVDASRRKLWAATLRWDSAAPPSPTGSRGWTAVNVYDLRTGELIRSYAPADRRFAHHFNDLALTAAGDVFVTDEPGGAVYRISAAADTMEMVLSDVPGFLFPNGIALAPDESRLYVAHMDGILVQNLRSGRTTPLAHPASVSTASIDGLYACGNALIAVQRMADFEQITRFDLSESGDEVIGGEALERRHPAYQQPTTGVLVCDALYYIANSQFARVREGVLAPASMPTPALVLRLPLGEDCS